MRERRVKLLSMVCGLWLLASVSVLADVIRLRDGSVLRGRVVAYSERKFTILVRIAGVDSRYVVPVEEVDSVEFGEQEEGSTVGEARNAGNARNVQKGGSGEGGGVGAEPLRPRPPAARPAPAGGAGAASPGRAVPSADRELSGVGETGTVIIEKKVTVAGAADWTSTEIRVQRGQRIVINASGDVDLGENQRSGPEGRRDLTDSRKPLPSQPTGGLVAVVGDDNDEYIFVGASTEFYAPHSGIIFLLINERTPQDNSGSYVARVRVLSNR